MKFLHRDKGVWAVLVIAGLLTFGVAAHAGRRNRKYTPPPPTANIKVTVLRATNGKPIANAAVIFHPIKDGKDDGALELKSDPAGIVKIDVIPVGDTVRLQVIADGWQTYGQDYPIDSDSKEIVVKMKRPVEQESSFRGSSGTSDMNNPTPKGESTSAKPSEQTPIPQ